MTCLLVWWFGIERYVLLKLFCVTLYLTPEKFCSRFCRVWHWSDTIFILFKYTSLIFCLKYSSLTQQNLYNLFCGSQHWCHFTLRLSFLLSTVPSCFKSLSFIYVVLFLKKYLFFLRDSICFLVSSAILSVLCLQDFFLACSSKVLSSLYWCHNFIQVYFSF